MLLLISVSGIAAVAALLYFLKTSKSMPKNWYEWKTEIRMQYVGMIGIAEDHFYRYRSKVVLTKQTGRVAVITGGNRGIGLRIVEKLLECEMTVVMGVRDPVSAEKSVSEIVDLTETKGKLIVEKLDVGSLSSVKAFGKKIQQNYEKVDILLNNAGIMFAPFKLTDDEFESQLAVNYLGHFVLTHMLLNLLKKAGTSELNSRIVNVSSIANLMGRINYNDINGKKHYYPATAYNQSKLAQILFTRHLNDMLVKDGSHVQCHAVHPGIVDTDLFANTSTTKIPFFQKVFFKTPEQGSRSVVYAAIDPSIEGKGGSYLSNCARSTMHPDAKDAEKCKKFFDFSCELVKIKDFGSGLV